MKTKEIVLNDIKATDVWMKVAYDLKYDKFREEHTGMDDEEISNKFYVEVVSKIFKYGEYANIRLVIDEDLNIVGGKII